MKIYIHLC